MNTRHFGFGLAFLTLAAAGTLLAIAQPTGTPSSSPSHQSAKPASAAQAEDKEMEGDEEEVIPLETAPETVRAAALKLVGDAKNIIKVIKEEDDEDVVTYEVEYRDGAIECAAVFSGAGDLMELEKSTTEGKLPAAVMAALKKDYPGATFEKPTSVTRMYFEIQVVRDGKQHEVKVDATGRIEDASSDDGKAHGGNERGDGDNEPNEERGQGVHGVHSAAPGDDGWRAEFAVNKADLAATGSGTYFVLQPGHKMTYTGGDVTLIVTVLDETRLIDEVTTRVVEERESKAGSLMEVSRNFFAIDPKSGDAYYFGEEVDIYEGGKIVKHEGEWLSGKDGARFGLFIPAAAKVGDKFYQEIAPGHAMDRFEIVSVGERVETPAGVFERVVKTEETTPLEQGKGFKCFAPGVGMISDGELKLTKIDPAPANK